MVGDDFTSSGKPSVSGQFKKGKSGNPKGRPKKKAEAARPSLADRPTDVQWLKRLYGTVSVRTAGGLTQMPFGEALIASIQAEALKGKRLHAKLIVDWMREAETKAAESKIEFSESLKLLKQRHQLLIDEARQSNKPEPRLFPHPADIIYDRTQFCYNLHGPISQEDAELFEIATPLREFFVIQSEMLRRHRPEMEAKPCPWLLMALLLDKDLPPSFRWQEETWTSVAVSYVRKPDYWLQKKASEKLEAGTRGTKPMTHEEFQAWDVSDPLQLILKMLHDASINLEDAQVRRL